MEDSPSAGIAAKPFIILKKYLTRTLAVTSMAPPCSAWL
jgi:hypothetical protein